ncbi:hypothetical protein EYF80_037491 [Liparis tanakae]|uniref:Uncharacterized protein n=1 Tax=Liparis tanakae TaxID=230148 RepID=A0A4Z2GFP5_9TELE|nr:hypothetical protein EYF80_037491 [Liparis tanakae]
MWPQTKLHRAHCEDAAPQTENNELKEDSPASGSAPTVKVTAVGQRAENVSSSSSVTCLEEESKHLCKAARITRRKIQSHRVNRFRLLDSITMQ